MGDISEVETPEGASAPSETGSVPAAPAAEAAPAPEQPEERAPAEGEASDAAADAEVDEAASGEAHAQGGGADEQTAAAPDETGADADAADVGESSSAGEVTAAGQEGAPKRKRRRRKKKKAEGAEAAAEGADPAADAKPKRKKEAVAPFLRFFVGAHAGKKHAFAPGEVVAGRVTALESGTITVDLFGKAVALVDEFEPREVPPEPEAYARHVGEAAPQAPGGESESEASPQHGAAPEEVARMEAPALEPGEEASEVADESAGAPQADRGAEAAAETSDEPIARPETDSAAAEPEATDPEAGATGPEAEAAAPAPVLADAEPVAAQYADSPLEASADDDVDADASEGHEHARGPLSPAPVVAEELGRPEPPQMGQVFRGRVAAVAESGHIALVNRNLELAAVHADLERYRQERRRVEGLVFGFNRGGFDVLVVGVRAFCPASAMALEEIEDPNEFVGRKFEFLLPASQHGDRDIVVSRRSILERQQRKKARELIKTLAPGQRFKGRVTHVRDFGVFVDIGGVEGLVHQSELSFTHGVKPADVASPGDEIEVQVLRVGGDPPRKGASRDAGRRDRVTRVSLSVKALLPDPWDEHAEALQEGTVREGKVTRTTDFGAFIELAPQIEGLVHISELGRDLKHANQVLNEGDSLHVVVERVDKKARRISLSKLSAAELEELQQGPSEGAEAPRAVRPGSRITVKVDRVEHRGIIVRVQGVLGRRARGFIPNSEMGGERGKDYRRSMPPGTEIDVKVIGIDRDGGLRCSPKALQIDDERRAVKDYRREAAKQGFGTFGDLLKAKLDQVTPKS